MQLLNNTNIDFISKTKITFFISLVIILLGISSLIIKKGPNLSIDFVGGTVIQVATSKEININELRNLVSKTILKKSEVTEITGLNINQQFRIKTNLKIENTTEISNAILESLSNYTPEVRAIESVGPKVGKELQFQAMYAIGLALLMLMIYIGFRFDIFYSLGSVVAIVHDVLITLVIFDRFRENSHKDLKLSLNELANLSLNQTLSRTIITSLTTLMVVVILFFVGGEIIKNFAFALIIGVIVGTYSSMFVASPFMLYLKSNIKVEEEE